MRNEPTQTMVDPKPKSRKPDLGEVLVSLRKGAGRGWVVAEQLGVSKYRARCLAHGTSKEFSSSAADAKAAVRLSSLWCHQCERDAPLFDNRFCRGDLKCGLRTQLDPWEMAIAVVDVPDSHPAFLIDYQQLDRFVPPDSGIKLMEPRIMHLRGIKGRGLRTAKRFQASVPLSSAQDGIVFIEQVAAFFGSQLMKRLPPPSAA